MKKLNIKNNRLRDNDCYHCARLAGEKNATQKDLDTEHEKCHGWTHCGDDCCGKCSYCGE